MTTTTSVLHSDSPAATERVGSVVGAALRIGDVVVLSGPLGAGKTCMVRGIVAGAGGDPAGVRSPTYVLHQPHRGRGLTVHHVDLYRLGPGADVEVLDLETALLDGALIIEWGEYADLAGFEPVVISIDAPPGAAGDQRVVRLTGGVAAHLREAWATALRSQR